MELLQFFVCKNDKLKLLLIFKFSLIFPSYKLTNCFITLTKPYNLNFYTLPTEFTVRMIKGKITNY